MLLIKRESITSNNGHGYKKIIAFFLSELITKENENILICNWLRIMEKFLVTSHFYVTLAEKYDNHCKI